MNEQLVFFFPGQGSQIVGMGKDLCKRFEVAREVFRRADEALGQPLSQLCFDGPEDELKRTENAQPAILATSIAAYEVARQELDVMPVLCVGHSLGEITALVAAGALGFEDAIRLVRIRGRAMQAAVPEGEGAMVAIVRLNDPVAAEQALSFLLPVCADGRVLEIANRNGGGQYVVAGHADAVERLIELGTQEGLRIIRLAVSAPFHSRLMAPAADRMEEALATVPLGKLEIPVLSSVDVRFYDSPAEIKTRLVRQLEHPVLWEGCLQELLRRRLHSGLELGPKRVLCDLARRMASDFDVRPLGTCRHLERLRKILVPEAIAA